MQYKEFQDNHTGFDSHRNKDSKNERSKEQPQTPNVSVVTLLHIICDQFWNTGCL